MNKEKTDFLESDDPFIIVRKLTKDIIEEAVKAYAAIFNRLQAEHMEYLKELDELDNF